MNEQLLVLISIVCFIGIYIAWETIKYNREKAKNERDNQKRSRECKNKKENSSCSAKVSKAKTQNKRKYKSPKKQTKR
jgi:amino acid permease